MKKYPMSMLRQKCLCFLVLAIVATHHAGAQMEYFVNVDRTTGLFRKISTLPDVKWIKGLYGAYDQQKHRYTFCGGDDSYDWRLYTIDALTGQVVYSPRFKDFGSDGRVYNLQFSESDGILYGLYWDNIAKKLSFVSVNPVTGDFNIINTIEGARNYMMPEAYFSPMIDKKRNRYMFAGSDTLNKPHLYTLDIATGNILYSPPFQLKIIQMKYDPGLDKIFGIYSATWGGMNGLVDTQQLVSVDPQSGNYETIGGPTIRNITAHFTLASTYTYREATHEYIFSGADTAGSYLVSLKANGEVTYMPNFSFVNHAGANVIVFQYDQSLDKLFAIHWEPKTIKGLSDNNTVVFPNPFTTDATIALKDYYGTVVSQVYDAAGRVVARAVDSNTNVVTIKRNALPTGVYFVRIVADGVAFAALKLLAE